ncbi:MAG: DUF1552 domain-containing protein [Deltaproteobacteria bacterium]|nr:DUF1552 domain-containing protein [Deltaproteobacteria bacterium]
MKLRFSRRRFLSSTTLGAVSVLPFYKALTPQAQAAPNAKFLAVMYNPFGVVRSNWFPATTGRNFEFKASSAPLAAVKNDLIMLSRIDNAMGEKNECKNGLDQHQAGVSSLFAGANMKPGKFGSGPGGPTIDSQVAKHLFPDRHHDQVVINLGVRSTEHGDAWIRYLFLKTDGSIVNSEDDPGKAFAALFGAGGTAGAPPAPKKPFTGLKDALKDDLLTFEKRLATPERERFQKYMESFEAYEKSMAVQMAPENLCKDLPSSSSIASQLKAGFRSENIWPIARLQMQLAVLALSCGARRVATLHLTDGFRGYLVPPGATPDTGVFGGHDLSHHTISGDPIKLRTNLNYNHAKLFAEFVTALKGASNPLSGSGTLFDDAVLLWGSCISGEGGGGHSKLQVPFTLAAGRNAGFVTGRHLDANFGTTSMLMRSVCNAFGMPDRPFGDAEFCATPLSGLTEDVGSSAPSARSVMDYKNLTDRCRGHAA